MEAPQKVIEINQTYVDEHLREFFDAKQTPVNIDNICLFSAKTIEEYNTHSEVKLSGQQKLEAAAELAKNVIDKAMVFVPEDQRRKISKNIYHNIDAIESTIQFVVDISNDPNIINIGKWVRSDTIAKKVKSGFFSKLFCCGGKKQEEVGEEKVEEPNVETKPEEVKVEEKKETKEEKKERLKKEKEEKKAAEEKAKEEKKSAEEQAKKEKEEKKKQEEQAKKDEIKRKKEEKKERERKIKELLEETDRKVKELKSVQKEEPAAETPSSEKPAEETQPSEEKEIEI